MVKKRLLHKMLYPGIGETNIFKELVLRILTILLLVLFAVKLLLLPATTDFHRFNSFVSPFLHIPISPFPISLFHTCSPRLKKAAYRCYQFSHLYLPQL